MIPADKMGEAPPVVVEARQWPVQPNKKYSNAQPLWQLILLDFVTFGLYFFYWSYRNWKHLKEYKRLDINPTWKALELLIPIVGIFFAYEQFVAFRDFSTEAGGKRSYDPVWVTIGLIVFNIVSKLPDPFWLLGALSRNQVIFNFSNDHDCTHLPIATKVWCNFVSHTKIVVFAS